MIIALFLLASIGAAYIVGWSEISYPIRRAIVLTGVVGRWLVSLIECAVCFGFWWGLGFGWFTNPLGLTTGTRWSIAIWTALVVAGSNLILARLGGMSVPAASSSGGPT